MDSCDLLNSKGIKARKVEWTPGQTEIHFRGSVEILAHPEWMQVDRVIQIWLDQSVPMKGNYKWHIRIDNGVTIME